MIAMSAAIIAPIFIGQTGTALAMSLGAVLLPGQHRGFEPMPELTRWPMSMQVTGGGASIACYRLQRRARSAVEIDIAADHVETAAAADRTAKIIFNFLR